MNQSPSSNSSSHSSPRHFSLRFSSDISRTCPTSSSTSRTKSPASTTGSAPSVSFILLQADEEIVSDLLSEKASFRGAREEEAVLCTSNRSYILKQLSTSNSLLIVSPHTSSNSASIAENEIQNTNNHNNNHHQNDASIVTSLSNSYFELVSLPCVRFLSLRTRLPFYKDNPLSPLLSLNPQMSTSTLCLAPSLSLSSSAPVSFQHLQNTVQASDLELLTHLVKLHALPLSLDPPTHLPAPNASSSLSLTLCFPLSFTTQPTTDWYLVSSADLDRLTAFIICTLNESDWPLHAIPLSALLQQLAPLFSPLFVFWFLSSFGQFSDPSASPSSITATSSISYSFLNCGPNCNHQNHRPRTTTFSPEPSSLIDGMVEPPSKKPRTDPEPNETKNHPHNEVYITLLTHQFITLYGCYVLRKEGAQLSPDSPVLYDSPTATWSSKNKLPKYRWLIMKDFLAQWRALFHNYTLYIEPSVLIGNCVLEDDKILCVPNSELSPFVEDRFVQIFEIKPSWTLDQIKPYLSPSPYFGGTNMDTVEQLLLKFTKVIQTADGQRLYTSR